VQFLFIIKSFINSCEGLKINKISKFGSSIILSIGLLSNKVSEKKILDELVVEF
jgi:hypothetical protein